MRPENTPLTQAEVVASDLHKLYWTEDEIMLDAKRIEGKCLVLPILKVSNILLTRLYHESLTEGEGSVQLTSFH